MKNPRNRPEDAKKRVEFLIRPDREGKLRGRTRGPLHHVIRVIRELASVFRRRP